MSGKNIVEKILLKSSAEKEMIQGETYLLDPDRIVLYDWPAASDWFSDMLEKELGIDKVPNPEKMVYFIDHLLPVTNPSYEIFHNGTRAWCDRNNVKYIENKGIGHLVAIEEGIIKPGMLSVHFDTHISTIGAIGALGFGIAKEVLMPMATGKMWLKVPPVIKINIKNEFRKGVSGRDLLHKIVYDYGPDWAINKIVVFGGEGAKNISMESRMVICDLANYFSAMTAIFEPDEITEDYMKEIGLKDYELVRSDADAEYEEIIDYDLSKVTPMIAVPPNTASIKPLEEVKDEKINIGIIGTCASGKLEDIKWAAEILKGKRIQDDFKLFVVPTSNRIYAEASKRGYLADLVEAGAFISSPTCDYCYGKAVCLSNGQKAISTQTLNVPGRLGCVDSDIYLSNAAVVAATALTGKLSDARDFME